MVASLKDIYDTIKSHCICLYLAGSTLIDGISHNDKEYTCICESKEDIEKCKALLQTTQHNYFVETGKILLVNFYIKDNLVLPDTIHSYLYHIAKSKEHYGTDINEFDYDILGDKKDIYKMILKAYFPFLEDKGKKAYHLLTGLYILDNNSYELTQEQLANIDDIKTNGYMYCSSAIRKYIADEITSI